MVALRGFTQVGVVVSPGTRAGFVLKLSISCQRRQWQNVVNIGCCVIVWN